MKQYNYEQIDEHIQWLIKMMETEFPNGYELTIDSTGAEIRNKQTYLNFLNKRFKDGNLGRTNNEISTNRTN